MEVYYNEFDKKKCAALKALMEDGHINRGVVDDRPIQEVRPDDLKGYTRAHFFAGIGLWDYALDLAGWPADRPVWTGSCPCQPFSSAGRQKGKSDDRHLWPYWQRLIEQCRPATVFGEQVSSAIAHGWLDDVYQGLEPQGYAIGAAVLPACGVGAPHKRDRLWFVAYAESEWPRGQQESGIKNPSFGRRSNNASKEFGVVGQPIGAGSQGYTEHEQDGYQSRRLDPQQSGSAWQTGIWLNCPDGKKRLVKPRICLLANGYPERVGLLHCAGDAIVPQVAAEFIGAFMGGETQ